MATQTVSTPTTQLAPPHVPTPPGSWQHPRMAEINRRRRDASFDDTKLRRVIWSIILLFASFFLPFSLVKLDQLLQANENTQLALTWGLRIFQVIVLCNGLLALRPLLPFGPKDDFSDIALTPRQRELLGLPPSSTPPTPGSTYVTPPRYVRTTPRAVSAASSRMATAGSSPGTRSTTDSPLGLRGSTFGSGGSLSASPASGLVRRATVAGSKRWSLGSGAGLKALEDSIFGPTPPTPSTPTPNSGQRATVALNNKWLYKRQHGSPGGSTKYI